MTPSKSVRERILARRAAFLSAALSGITAAGCAPSPPPAPPSTPATPACPPQTVNPPPAPTATPSAIEQPDASLPPPAPTDPGTPPNDLLHPDAYPSICLSDIDIGADPL